MVKENMRKQIPDITEIPLAEMEERAVEVAILLKTLAHPARLMLACTLAQGSFLLASWKPSWISASPHFPSNLGFCVRRALLKRGARPNRSSTG